MPSSYFCKNECLAYTYLGHGFVHRITLVSLLQTSLLGEVYIYIIDSIELLKRLGASEHKTWCTHLYRTIINSTITSITTTRSMFPRRGHTHPAAPAVSVSSAAWKDKFRQNPRSHSTSAFLTLKRTRSVFWVSYTINGKNSI